MPNEYWTLLGILIGGVIGANLGVSLAFWDYHKTWYKIKRKFKKGGKNGL